MLRSAVAILVVANFIEYAVVGIDTWYAPLIFV